MSKPARSAVDQIEFMRNALALTLCGGFVGMIPLFVFKAIPTGNEQLITYMLGQLSGMALTALSFYFVNKVGQDAVDAKRVDNTSKALDAIAATAKAAGGPATDAVADAAEATAGAAVDKAAEIAGKPDG